MRISEDFKEIWNLSHCIGAIDGKHIAMKSPLNSGSLFYNYKGYFSTILMAICDARYVFTLVDIGSYGSNHDSGVFRNSKMGKAFFNNLLSLSEPECLMMLRDLESYLTLLWLMKRFHRNHGF